MTAEEIFKNIAGHMIEGMMFHQQMSEYYEFLGLNGYAECHYYHFLDESCQYHDLCSYYIRHYNKLLPMDELKDPKVIPTTWYKYMRIDVDSKTKRAAVQSGLERWVTWEQDTRSIYERAYHDLFDLNEMAAAHEVKQLIQSVEEEISKAEQYLLNKQAIDYNIESIISEQKSHHEEYEIKTRSLFLNC